MSDSRNFPDNPIGGYGPSLRPNHSGPVDPRYGYQPKNDDVTRAYIPEHKQLNKTEDLTGSYDKAPTNLSDNPTYTSADGISALRLHDHENDPIDPVTGRPSLGTVGNLAVGTAALAGGNAVMNKMLDKGNVNAIKNGTIPMDAARAVHDDLAHKGLSLIHI